MLSAILGLGNGRFSAILGLGNGRFSAILGLGNGRFSAILGLGNGRFSAILGLGNGRFSAILALDNGRAGTRELVAELRHRSLDRVKCSSGHHAQDHALIRPANLNTPLLKHEP